MKSKKYDIVINGHFIGGRQGWAYICNAREIPVLNADFDKSMNVDFEQFGRVALQNGKGRIKIGDLEYSNENENPRWMIGSSGTFISSSFTMQDAIDLITDATAPTVTEGEIVAIGIHTKEVAMLNLFRVGRVDMQCSVMCVLTPLTDEEMAQIVTDAEKWCDAF